jgi:hypothetical protein
MSCPHSKAIGSNPQSCSLCRGAVPKLVAVTDGIVTVDGKSIGTLQDINRGRYESETQNSLPQRKKTCGRCGRAGHNRTTCHIDIRMTGPSNVPDDQVN